MGDSAQVSYSGFISTEKCVEVTRMNKYHVAWMVAKRARELASGVQPVISRSNKIKNVTLALAEVSSGLLDISSLNTRAMHNLAVPKEEAPRVATDVNSVLEELKQEVLSEFGVGDSITDEKMLSNSERDSISYVDEESDGPDS